VPQGKNRTLQALETFLRKRLRTKLRHDLRLLRIVKEADVECAAYYHIRCFLGEDPRWRVLARKHVRVTGHYVDLLILKRTKPVIAVELKWGRRQIDRKDKKRLSGALKRLDVNKVYWLSALSGADGPRVRTNKKPSEKYVFHQVLVTHGLTGDAFEEWKKKRKRLKNL